MKEIREVFNRNKERIRGQMDIDYKLEREKIDLKEQGSDDENPKSIKIKKRLALL